MTDATEMARAARLAAIEREYCDPRWNWSTVPNPTTRWLLDEMQRLEYELMLANDALASYAMLVDRRDRQRAAVLEAIRAGQWTTALRIAEGQE